MANINAALPTAIAVPFHPATEALQQENLIKPVIPKTEVIASYAKFREGEDNPQYSSQSRTYLQGESEKQSNDKNEHQTRAQQRRLNFFAKRSETKEQHESKALEIVSDFKLSLTVIQEKYNRAVTPIPDPSIDYAI
tara:strand:+ start:5005 stop:5415 length:411 start_codon:yes stop_codon:yes gene_type:complete